MNIDYYFDFNKWTYEADIDRVTEFLVERFAENYGMDLGQAKILYTDSWLDLDALVEAFEDELREEFKGDALDSYNRWRYGDGNY